MDEKEVFARTFPKALKRILPIGILAYLIVFMVTIFFVHGKLAIYLWIVSIVVISVASGVSAKLYAKKLESNL